MLRFGCVTRQGKTGCAAPANPAPGRGAGRNGVWPLPNFDQTEKMASSASARAGWFDGSASKTSLKTPRLTCNCSSLSPTAREHLRRHAHTKQARGASSQDLRLAFAPIGDTAGFLELASALASRHDRMGEALPVRLNAPADPRIGLQDVTAGPWNRRWKHDEKRSRRTRIARSSGQAWLSQLGTEDK